MPGAMEDAYSFVILDLVSSNAVAYADTFSSGEAIFLGMLEEQPVRAPVLALVGLDKEGFPIAQRTGSDFQVA